VFSPSNKDWIRPKDYNDTTCVETFLSRFECTANYNGWNATDKAANLKACLTGAAEYLVWNSEDKSYEEMKTKLRHRFGAADQQGKFRLELKYRKRKPSETLQELASEVERLIQLPYPDKDPELLDTLALDCFIDNLDDKKLQNMVRLKEPAILRQALTQAMRLEVMEQCNDGAYESSRRRQGRAINATREESTVLAAETGFATGQHVEVPSGGSGKKKSFDGQKSKQSFQPPSSGGATVEGQQLEQKLQKTSPKGKERKGRVFI